MDDGEIRSHPNSVSVKFPTVEEISIPRMPLTAVTYDHRAGMSCRNANVRYRAANSCSVQGSISTAGFLSLEPYKDSNTMLEILVENATLSLCLYAWIDPETDASSYDALSNSQHLQSL